MSVHVTRLQQCKRFFLFWQLVGMPPHGMMPPPGFPEMHGMPGMPPPPGQLSDPQPPPLPPP